MFFGVFLGPILALVLFNTVVFVLVVRVLIIHGTRKMADFERKAQIQATIKILVSVVSIMFMFGIQWLFGAFTIAEASIVFQWLFVIFSTLQGFFLFLFFVVLSQEAREEWLNAFSFGLRKKKKRGAITSHASQGTRRDRNTGSTYLTSKNPYSRTIRKAVTSSSDGESSIVEMTDYRKKLLMAPPTSISEDKETVFVIENGTSNGDIQKVNLANGHSNIDGSNEPSMEVPDHILQRRYMFHNPAVTAPPTDSDEKKSLESEDEYVNSESSMTEGYDIIKSEFGDLTQLTELSFFSNNSDASDTELSYL